MKKAVVTTFHKDGYEKYGRKMIETFLKTIITILNNDLLVPYFYF
jgi:hypothetical protein